MKKKFIAGLAVVAAVTGLSTAHAMDTFLIGPRAMGMAGANVASVDNNSAQYYNPAAFGFFGRHNEDDTKSEEDRNNLGRKDFGFDVYAGVGVEIKKDLGKFIDTLAKSDIDTLTKNGIQTDSDLQKAIELITNLNGLDEPGNALLMDVDAGTSLRIKHFGLGLRAYSQLYAAVPNVDSANLGLDLNTADLATEINTAATDPAIVKDGFATYFSAAQYAALTSILSNSTSATDIVEYYAQQQGISSSQIDQLITTLNGMANNSAPNSAGDLTTNTAAGLNANTTTVELKGFGVAEVPLSYGYAINDNIAVGANLKLMKGRVYGTQVLVFSEGSGDVLKKTDENYQETTTYGVDLGVMARYSMFNFGLTGRNLNSPKFDGFTKTVSYTLEDGSVSNKLITVSDVKMKPQATAGIAFIPFETLTVEADYDLTKNETIISGYKTQNFSAGLEWDLLRTLALRAGTYKNMAESDTGWVYTAGVGLNLWAARIDIAAAASPDKVQYDGEEVPKLAKASVQVSIDF